MPHDSDDIIKDLFGNTSRPKIITEGQFDGFEDQLLAIVDDVAYGSPVSSWWEYLLNLKYLKNLQQELFDFLFPALLIDWKRSLLERTALVGGEIYSPIYIGKLIQRMVPQERRGKLFTWFASAFCDGVDAFPPIPKGHVQTNKTAIHFYLHHFNAIGQSLPIIDAIWKRLAKVETVGAARFWLVFISGFAHECNKVPWIKPWDSITGGGGVYLTDSKAELYESGYMQRNLSFVTTHLCVETLLEIGSDAKHQLSGHEKKHLHIALEEIQQYFYRVELRIESFLETIKQPF